MFPIHIILITNNIPIVHLQNAGSNIMGQILFFYWVKITRKMGLSLFDPTLG